MHTILHILCYASCIDLLGLSIQTPLFLINIIHSTQTLTFDDSRVLHSVVSDEQLSSTREDLLGYPVHSHNELILLNKVAVGQNVAQRPTGLISEPVLINNVSNIDLLANIAL